MGVASELPSVDVHIVSFRMAWTGRNGQPVERTIHEDGLGLEEVGKLHFTFEEGAGCEVHLGRKALEIRRQLGAGKHGNVVLYVELDWSLMLNRHQIIVLDKGVFLKGIEVLMELHGYLEESGLVGHHIGYDHVYMGQCILLIKSAFE